MSKYLTIVDRDDSTLLHIINATSNFGLPNVLEAVSLNLMTEHEVRQMIIEIQQKKLLMNRESLALAEFSETFNKLYATDNNTCFEVAARLFGKIRSTMSGYKRVFMKFCPKIKGRHGNGGVRPSALIHSVIVNRQYYADLFGDEGYIDAVKNLYWELYDFFALGSVTLALCHRVIMDEERIRNNFALLKPIYEESCAELLGSCRIFSNVLVKVKQLPENELQRRKQKAKSLKTFITENFHRFTKAELAEFVVLEAIREGNNDGLTDLEMSLWPKDHQKALEVRNAIEILDTLGLQLKELKSGEKQFKSTELVYLLKWSGVGYKKERKFYCEYLPTQYPGITKFPSWQSVSRERKALSSISEHDLSQAFARMLPSKTHTRTDLPQFTQNNTSPMA